VVILLVDLEVLREVADALCEQCDLHLSRTSVAFAALVLSDDSGNDVPF
jgi:hypothetical protein